MTGSCICTTIRYRLLTSPLYCYACHCPDCQKLSGSAFGLFLSIEPYNLEIISPTAPVFVKRAKKPPSTDITAECPRCSVQLWSHGGLGEAVLEVRVGTLDFPALMQPDVHIFVGSKLEWVGLPRGAKVKMGAHDVREMWPKSSLERLEVCMRRVAEGKKKRRVAGEEGGGGAVPLGGEEVADEGAGGEGEKTPTAGEFGGEDDEEFERRVRETERALLERLGRLSLKLGEGDGKEKKEEAIVGPAGTGM
ncbi:aldehyde-activating protein [Pyrenophora teres f. maculata]|nr:aldehyde-activating protein [Pyrenophora teres f. maculata]